MSVGPKHPILIGWLFIISIVGFKYLYSMNLPLGAHDAMYGLSAFTLIGVTFMSAVDPGFRAHLEAYVLLPVAVALGTTAEVVILGMTWIKRGLRTGR